MPIVFTKLLFAKIHAKYRPVKGLHGKIDGLSQPGGEICLKPEISIFHNVAGFRRPRQKIPGTPSKIFDPRREKADTGNFEHQRNELHAKIGQLTFELDFLRKTSKQPGL